MLGKADRRAYEQLSADDKAYVRRLLLSLCDMTEDERARTIASLGQDVLALLAVCGPILNAYTPHSPDGHFKQWVLLSQPISEVRDVFYGGAAGGGKSDGLLTAALQYVDVPGYAALILRKTYQDLSLPGALMDRAKDWLIGTDATWREKLKRWDFPGGAVLQFGYLEHTGDEQRYQSAEFQYVGVDEGSHIPERQLDYVASRIRRPNKHKPNASALAAVPLRLRIASNPGGISHNTLKARYIEPHSKGTLPEDRAVIRSTLEDNPYIDRDEYEQQLASIADPVDRERLRRGDWEVVESGGTIRREWLRYLEHPPAELRAGALGLNGVPVVRRWDLAGSPITPSNRDPDYTAGYLLALLDGRWYILDGQLLRGTPGRVEALVRETALLDGRHIPIDIEQEPGQSGKAQVAYYQRLLAGYSVSGSRATGSKAVRLAPFASAAEAGNVYLVTDYYQTGQVATWLRPTIEQLTLFPNAPHDDIPDAISGGVEYLTPKPRKQKRRPVPLGLSSVVAADVPRSPTVTSASPPVRNGSS